VTVEVSNQFQSTPARERVTTIAEVDCVIQGVSIHTRPWAGDERLQAGLQQRAVSIHTRP